MLKGTVGSMTHGIYRTILIECTTSDLKSKGKAAKCIERNLSPWIVPVLSLCLNEEVLQTTASSQFRCNNSSPAFLRAMQIRAFME